MHTLAKKLILFISINLLLANGSLSLSDNGDGTWDVGYVTDTAIGGFQMIVDDATINSASGGDAEANGFMITEDGLYGAGDCRGETSAIGY